MTLAASNEPLLLASASPRRRELLTLIGVRFVVAASRFDEHSLQHLTDAETYVRAAATGKAEEVAARRDGVILGVDTDVVAPDGEILGKPTDAEDAYRMLRRLAGRTHRVLSGVCLLRSHGGEVSQQEVRVVETRVTFGEMPDDMIRAYIATGEPMDKAGGYGIQSGGLAFATRLDGDLSNVIGLPLPTMTAMLPSFGILPWSTEQGRSAAGQNAGVIIGGIAKEPQHL